jgi:hypothetical protein
MKLELKLKNDGCILYIILEFNEELVVIFNGWDSVVSIANINKNYFYIQKIEEFS